MSEHTPLPWEVVENRIEHTNYIGVLEKTKQKVIIAHCVNNKSNTIGLVVSPEDGIANADYIVKACNTYPKLVEELKKQLYPMRSFRTDGGDFVDIQTVNNDRETAIKLLTDLNEMKDETK